MADAAELTIPSGWTFLDTSDLMVDRGKNDIYPDNANATYITWCKDLSPAGWRVAHHTYYAGTFANPSGIGDPAAGDWAGDGFADFMAQMNTFDSTVKFLYGYNGGPATRPSPSPATDPTNISSGAAVEGSTAVYAGFVSGLDALYPGRMHYEPFNEPGTQHAPDGGIGHYWYNADVDAMAWAAVHERNYLDAAAAVVHANATISFSGGFAQSGAVNSPAGGEEVREMLDGQGSIGNWPAALNKNILHAIALRASSNKRIIWSQHAYTTSPAAVDDRDQGATNRHIYPTWRPATSGGSTAADNPSGYLSGMDNIRALLDSYGGQSIGMGQSEYEPTTEISNTAVTGRGALQDALVSIVSWNRQSRWGLYYNLLMSVMRDNASWPAWPAGSPATSPGSQGDAMIIMGSSGQRLRTPRYFCLRDILIPFDRIAKKRITVPLWTAGVGGKASDDTAACTWNVAPDLTPATTNVNAAQSIVDAVGRPVEEDELWIVLANAHKTLGKNKTLHLPSVPSGSVKARFNAANPVTRTNGQMAAGSAGQILYTKMAATAAISSGTGDASAGCSTGAFTIAGSTITLGSGGAPTLGAWDTILLRVPTAPGGTPAAPVYNVAPTISDTTPTEQQVLTTTPGTFSAGSPAPTVTRKWQRAATPFTTWVDIAGQTGLTYTVQAGDVGYELRVHEDASNGSGSASSNSAATAVVVAQPPPRSLVSLTDTFGSDDLTIWQNRLDAGTAAAVSGGRLRLTTSPNGIAERQLIYTAYTFDETYLEVVDLTGIPYCWYQVHLDATNYIGIIKRPDGKLYPFTHAPSQVDLAVGVTYDPVAHRWWRHLVTGATTFFQVGAGPTGPWTTLASIANPISTVAVQVRIGVYATATDASATALFDNFNTAGTVAAPVNSALPTISGSAIAGAVLTRVAGTWSGSPALTYQWQDSANGTTGWANISGATGTTYTVGVGEVGLYLRVVETGTNGGGAAVANSAATGQVQAAVGGGARNTGIARVAGTRNTAIARTPGLGGGGL